VLGWLLGGRGGGGGGGWVVNCHSKVDGYVRLTWVGFWPLHGRGTQILGYIVGYKRAKCLTWLGKIWSELTWAGPRFEILAAHTRQIYHTPLPFA